MTSYLISSFKRFNNRSAKLNIKSIRRMPALVLIVLLAGCAQKGGNNALGKAFTNISGLDSRQLMRSALTDSEVVAGLKEALASGVETAINTLGRPGGFLGNKLVEIAVPDAIEPIASAARTLGQGDQVDALETTMNRAAEKAVPQAAGILGDAIRAMTVDDAMSILNGKNDAATKYFQRVSEDKLAASFKPIVKRVTDQVGVTAAYKELIEPAGGLLNLAMPDNKLDIDTYITDEALDGLFTYIAKQEKNIRKNPAARATDLLKKVFGS